MWVSYSSILRSPKKDKKFSVVSGGPAPAQGTRGRFGRSSARKGIEPDELQKKGIKLYVSDISLAKDYARYDKEFKEIFNLR